jgi:phosphoketolase
MEEPLSQDALSKMIAYWRAANYLSVGQIYLHDNPLLKDPLRPEQIKPRLLGHFGTVPGLNLIYVHKTGPAATGWHSNKFLDPASDGAVLPILHLNGYKIANPTILARIEPEELEQLFRGYGYNPYVVEGDDPEAVHQAMAYTLEKIVLEIQAPGTF